MEGFVTVKPLYQGLSRSRVHLEGQPDAFG